MSPLPALLTMPSGRSLRCISCAVCALIWSIELSMLTALKGMAAAPVSISPSEKPLTRMVVVGERRGRREQRQLAPTLGGELAHRFQREGVVVEIVEGMGHAHVGAAVRGEREAALGHVADARIVRLGA